MRDDSVKRKNAMLPISEVPRRIRSQLERVISLDTTFAYSLETIIVLRMLDLRLAECPIQSMDNSQSNRRRHQRRFDLIYDSDQPRIENEMFVSFRLTVAIGTMILTRLPS